MSNLVKIVTKAKLGTDAEEAIEKEIKMLSTDIRVDTKSSAKIRLYGIIDNCIHQAYLLGKME